MAWEQGKTHLAVPTKQLHTNLKRIYFNGFPFHNSLYYEMVNTHPEYCLVIRGQSGSIHIVVKFLQQNPKTGEHQEVREDGECVPVSIEW